MRGFRAGLTFRETAVMMIRRKPSQPIKASTLAQQQADLHRGGFAATRQGGDVGAGLG